MLPLITFAAVLTVLILIHELGHFIFAKRAGVRVEVFSLGFGKKLFGIKRKGTEYRISGIPFGGYVKMAGEMPYEGARKGAPDEFMSRPVSARAAILAAGPGFNYLLGILLFMFIFMTGNPQVTSLVGGVMDGYPAKEAGIIEGDRIVELNGKEVFYWEEVLSVVHKATQGSVAVKIKRQEREFTYALTPNVKEFKNVFGQKVRIGLLGITPSGEIKYVRYPVHKAAYMALDKTLSLTWMTCLSLWRMMTGAMSFKDSVAGPIGIFVVTSKAAYAGFVYVAGLVAVLSISLAIFNLLPIPVLDGGHLFFLIVEKIRGKVVSEKIYERLTHIGMAFLVTLMAFVIYNDAARAGWIEKIFGLVIRKP